MSKLPLTFGDLSLHNFNQFFVGFDELHNRMLQVDNLVKNNPSYPPYNIRKVSDTNYQIEIAVAGFSMKDIDITLEEDKLTIKGAAEPDSNANYTFKGIAMRDFTRTFALSNDVEVRGASLIDGMLKIELERVIPDSKKPKKILINQERLVEAEKTQPQLLTENA